MTILIHGGMQKAGSKAIQRFLHDNSAMLSGLDVHVSEAGCEGRWHRPFFESCEASYLDVLRAELDRSQFVILSYEEFYLLSTDRIEKLIQVDPEIRLLVFERDPDEWIQSYFNQLVKAHRVRYDQVMAFTPETEDVRNRLGVKSHLRRWASVVGSENVTRKSFRLQTDVVLDLIEWMGIPDEVRQSFVRDFTNPNLAADQYSLRVLIEVKRRINACSEEDHIAVLGRAHEVLKSRWVDTRKKSGPLLNAPEVKFTDEAPLASPLTASEMHTVLEILDGF